MNKLAEALYGIVSIVTWLAGIVLAKGGWAIFFACIFPPWAWYLCVERAMHFFGVSP